MRIVAFVLVALVFVVALGNYQRASKDAAPAKAAPVSASASTNGAVTAPAGLSAFNAVPAVAANVTCVHRADGATVCGPVVEGGNKATPSIFDQPVAPSLAPPPPPAVKVKSAQNRIVRKIKFDAITPKQVQTPPIPQQQKMHSARRITSLDAPHSQLEQDHGPAPRFERKPRTRYSGGGARRLKNEYERPPVVAERQDATHRHAVERGALAQRKPPAQYSAGNLRRFENEHERSPVLAERPGVAPRYGAERGPPSLFGREPPARYRTANIRRLEGGREGPPLFAERQEADFRHSAERDSPPLIEREPPRRRERSPMFAERRGAAPRYDDAGHGAALPRTRDVKFVDLERRTLELERELRSLRAERAEALRHVERRDAGKRPYSTSPPIYSRERIVQPD